mmetsp:Transcript_62721/g.127416  ORF Transcript_62721/g.127416 Transcript_62721/m.127416 type:complete len:122 (+) Transcript_62721:53-418(+)
MPCGIGDIRTLRPAENRETLSNCYLQFFLAWPGSTTGILEVSISESLCCILRLNASSKLTPPPPALSRLRLRPFLFLPRLRLPRSSLEVTEAAEMDFDRLRCRCRWSRFFGERTRFDLSFS